VLGFNAASVTQGLGRQAVCRTRMVQLGVHGAGFVHGVAQWAWAWRQACFAHVAAHCCTGHIFAGCFKARDSGRVHGASLCVHAQVHIMLAAL
jgi:hypothetical protein